MGPSLPRETLEDFLEEVVLSWASKLGGEHFNGKRREKRILAGTAGGWSGEGRGYSFCHRILTEHQQSARHLTQRR